MRQTAYHDVGLAVHAIGDGAVRATLDAAHATGTGGLRRGVGDREAGRGGQAVGPKRRLGERVDRAAGRLGLSLGGMNRDRGWCVHPNRSA
jgi:hypothetical protein